MAKRTGNSSVNSSIRQQTAANNEGLGSLLEAQQASLGELSSIRKLMELSKDHEKLQKNANGGQDNSKIQEEILDVTKQQLRGSRTFWKTREEMDKIAYQESDKIAELAKAMNTKGNFAQGIGDSLAAKKEGIKDKFGIANGGLKKTVLGALNVGGIFNKTLAKDSFKQKQKVLGNDVTDEDAEGAYNTSKQIKAHDQKISALKAKHGISDEEFSASKTGKEMLNKKEELTNQYRSYDKSAKSVTPDPTEREINYKTPTATAAEATQGAEAMEEGKKMSEDELHYLKIIADNTGGKDKSKETKPAETKKEGGGLIDIITGFLGEGFMTALKSMFSPANILKSLGKVFAIGMIVGALFEGIWDGFEEFQKSGDIGKALVAGLAGIVDFLTFGLFDKDKIKEVIGDMAGWLNDHVIKPYVDFITGMKDSFLSLLSAIKIPAITIPLPKVLGGDITIGPFDPFGGSNEKKPEAATPTSATTVEQKSADNAAASGAPVASNKTNVVNAPQTTNNTTNQVIKSPIRNQESSQSRYLSTKYA